MQSCRTGAITEKWTEEQRKENACALEFLQMSDKHQFTGEVKFQGFSEARKA